MNPEPLAGETLPIDPADYPCRIICRPEHPAPDARVAIVWQWPWAPPVLAVIAETLAEGGGVLLLGRDRADLVRKREAIELLISAPAGAA